MSLTPPPTAPSRATDSAAAFATKADAMMTWLGTNVTELGALQTDVASKQTTASTAATTATAQASTATTQAAAAAASALQAQNSAVNAGSPLWVSGTTYSIGNLAYSPITLQNFRRKTNGAGTVDPSMDSTNWACVLGGTPIGALLAFDADQTANLITTPDGASYLKTGVIADATGYPGAAASPYVTAVTQ